MSDKRTSHYIPEEIEGKWQKIWEEKGTFSPDISVAKNPYYNLMMFPYPSAEGLHVGNVYAFTGADVFARYNRMLGRDVFEPIGLDGFGIHSENYALKVGRHPKEQGLISEKNFYRQLRSIGNSFDWKRTVETYNPDYYKWTQWLFIQMFKAGLVYRDKALVNWCPSCKTVLSDEQVVDGSCERCGTKVEKRNLEQWFFRITKYAERLLNNIEDLNWTERVKIAQRNWIGKSEGAEVKFKIQKAKGKNSIQKLKLASDLVEKVLKGEKYKTYRLIKKDFKDGETISLVDSSTGEEFAKAQIKLVEQKMLGEVSIDEPGHEAYLSREDMYQAYNGYYPEIEVNDNTKVWMYTFDIIEDSLVVFTTRPDTLFGATFMVVAPEHTLTATIENDEVKKYVDEAKKKTEIERTAEGKEKTGVFSGLYAINPVNNEKIPIWIADYVLSGYGTGAIMAVPAHDVRDYAFAKKYGLKIVQVIDPQDKSVGLENEAYVGSGKLINSGEWDGFDMPKEMDKVLASLEEKGLGVRKANYHLRDWLISRQRYWGPPIPMIFCSECSKNGKAEVEGMDGWFTVPDRELPVLLPDVADWKPMGTGKSPLANHPEFFKTTCPSCKGPAERETDVSDTFLDSAWYFLRYPSTDIEKAPFDTDRTRKWLPVNQYIGGAEHSVLHLLYSRFVTMVLADLNLIDFEEPFTNFYAHGLIIKDGAKMSKSKGNVVVPDEYIGKYGADTLRAYLMFIGPYSDGGDFRDSGIEGMNKFLRKVWKLLDCEAELNEISAERARIMHKTIKKVTYDISTFSYNTAIASLMEWYNYLSADIREGDTALNKEEQGVFLKLLAPFAPHLTEELWQSGDKRDDTSEFKSIHLSSWPEYDEKYLVSSKTTVVVQVNGKRRAEIEVESSKIEDQSHVEELAKEATVKHLEGQNLKKTIYVRGKILNFVV